MKYKSSKDANAAMREASNKINDIREAASFAHRELTDEEKSSVFAAEQTYNQAQREFSVLFNDEQAALNKREAKVEFSMTKALREALHSNHNQVNVREAISAAGLAGKAVDVELAAILEPLHANSALTKLGVKWYTGMPMGDISIPVMGKGQVSWAGEKDASTDGTPAYGDNIKLSPKRLTGYFDITEQMLLQDTIGVEAALRREAVAALADAFEATVLGNEAGTAKKPAGLFYNKTISSADTFAKVVELESNVEDNCIGGEMKYLLSTKAKAAFRAMAKSSKNTQLVMEGGMIDGTPTVVTQNVKNGTKGLYAFGNFANLACAVWNDVILKVDDSIVYGDGLIRIYVSGYFDASVLREGAFVFGDAKASADVAAGN